MKISVNYGDALFTFDLDSNETVENLKALLEVESGLPLPQQIVLFQNKQLRNDASLESYGVKEDDVLIMQAIPAPPPPGARDMTSLLQGLLRPPNPDDRYRAQAQKLREEVTSNPELMARLRIQNPQLVDAIEAVNPAKLVEWVKKQHQQQQKLRQAQNLAAMDPLNPEGQKAIEEALHQERVKQNYEQAQEYYPQFFGNITMLYVEMEVNKKPVQAFVDSGAQSTIMSKSLADRCGLLKLLDTRFQGIAQGVGTSKILGKIHAADVMIGGKYFACSLTVLEDNKVDFLFGLDNLKRHQCCIDLVADRLTLLNGEVSVPFLPESKIIPNELFASHLLKQAQKKAEDKKEEEPKPKVGAGGHPREKIINLVELGFSEEQAVDALNKTKGNAELAAALLWNQI